MNTELRKNAKNNLEKYFFKLMDNAVFGKTMENVKLVTTEARNSYLVSEPNYHTAIFLLLLRNSLVIEMKKTLMLINKPQN